MSNIPTPHINVSDKSLIAKTVLMPGDPLRAKYLAEHFLDDCVMFNTVRNMFGYTGYYKGKRISVMASGMGMPSIGIYSYELFKFYDCDRIIRIGSAGAYTKDLNIYDCVLVNDCYSETTYAKVAFGFDNDIAYPTKSLNEKIIDIAKKFNIDLKQARCHSSDVFYHANDEYLKLVRDEKKCKAVEMESFALFSNALALNKEAACLLTISDSFVTNDVTTSEEREKTFTNMMKIALELA